MIKVMAAMSGGVDSSVAAYMLKAQGYQVTGVTMKLFSNEDIGIEKERSCCSLDDISDARSVAAKMDIPHYVFDFSAEFKNDVIERFVGTYISGATPNPCIDCNRYIKFDKMAWRAEQFGFNKIATGHYAVIQKDSCGRYLLRKGFDRAKDQSYVLYSLTQKQLARTLLPLGMMTKDTVRDIADREGFINARKKDSQDICFVKSGNYAEFIEKYSGVRSEQGDFIDKEGNFIGHHKGIIRYTIGQHKKLGAAPSQQGLRVSSKDPVGNTITLDTEENMYSRTVYIKDLNLIPFDIIKSPLRISAKIRYRQEEQPAIAEQTEKDMIRIDFEKPQRAPAKGQAAVMYDGDIVIGGGTIE
jgi:tRNA-specific 2-thiouridylase